MIEGLLLAELDEVSITENIFAVISNVGLVIKEAFSTEKNIWFTRRVKTYLFNGSLTMLCAEERVGVNQLLGRELTKSGLDKCAG